jgi:hypothetical protein
MKRASCITSIQKRANWSDLLKLYLKILYWFYYRQQRSKAARFLPRFNKLLKELAPDHSAIRGEQCWSLYYEVKGNLIKAIQHKKNEIKLIVRFLKLRSGLTDYGPGELADAMVSLAILYADNSDFAKAVLHLHEAKDTCIRARLPFDADGLIEYYKTIKEKGSNQNGP